MKWFRKIKEFDKRMEYELKKVVEGIVIDGIRQERQEQNDAKTEFFNSLSQKLRLKMKECEDVRE